MLRSEDITVPTRFLMTIAHLVVTLTIIYDIVSDACTSITFAVGGLHQPLVVAYSRLNTVTSREAITHGIPTSNHDGAFHQGLGVLSSLDDTFGNA